MLKPLTVMTKNGEIIELTEEEFKKRSKRDHNGVALDDKCESEEKLRNWALSLNRWLRSNRGKLRAKLEAEVKVEEKEAEKEIEKEVEKPASKTKFKKAEGYIKKKKLKIKINEKMTEKEIIVLIQKAIKGKNK